MPQQQADEEQQPEADEEQQADDVASGVLLKMHKLARDDIEADAWELYESSGRDLLTLERIARVVSVNKLMQQRGLPGLSFADGSESAPRSMMAAGKRPVTLYGETPPTAEQQQLATDMGLTQPEHFAIHGDYAKFMGLQVNKHIALKMQKLWHSKEGRVMNASDDMSACRKFVLRNLKRFAMHARLRCERNAERSEVQNAVRALAESRSSAALPH